MRIKKLQQPINSDVVVDSDLCGSVAYKEIIAYDANGQVVYDNVQRPRYQNGRGFVISYTEKISDFLMKVPTGSIVRVFMYIAHHQSYGQGGCFGFRCSHKHIEQALRLDRTTVWDALKFLKSKNLINESRIDGSIEFMVNPDYITIGADKKLRVREWVRRQGGSVESLPPVPVLRRPVPAVSRKARIVVECDI